MKHILLLLLSFFAPVVWGQQVEQFKLWPDKPEAGEAEIFVYHPAKNGKLAPAVLISEIQDAGRRTYDPVE